MRFQNFFKKGRYLLVFYERLSITQNPMGIFVYITSNKWMRAGYGEKNAEFLQRILILSCSLILQE